MDNLKFLKLVLERFDICWCEREEENIIEIEIDDYTEGYEYINGMKFYFSKNQYLPNYERIKQLEREIADKQKELEMLKKVLTDNKINDII